MNVPFSSVLVSLLLVVQVVAAQEHLRPQTRPDPAVYTWRWFETQKQVTHQFPTDYHVGCVYCLKQDVVVECGGTDSRVSPYWVSAYRADEVEAVKVSLSAPQAAKEREIRVLQQVAANNPRLANGVSVLTRGIEKHRETRSIVRAGTQLRFQQLWLRRNFEMGVSVRPYAEVLDGPLQGKWVNIQFLSDCSTDANGHCNLNSKYIEYVTASPNRSR